MTASATTSIPPDGNGVSYRWRLVVGAMVNLGFATLAVTAWKLGAHELALVLGGTTGLYRVAHS